MNQESFQGLLTAAVKRPTKGVRLARLSRDDMAINTQMVCFPPNAGGYFSFLPWPKTPSGVQPIFPPTIGLWGGQLDWAEAWTYAALISALTDAVEEQLQPVPLVLCGCSLGGLLAFGVARELRRRQAKTPLGLVVISMCAPQWYRPQPLGEDLTDAEWATQFRRRGGTPEQVLTNPTRLAELRRQIQGGLSMAQTYAFSEELPLEFPIGVFGGEEDQEFEPSLLMGWSQQTTGACSPVFYPLAGHLDLLQDPVIRRCFLVDLVALVQHWSEVMP